MDPAKIEARHAIRHSRSRWSKTLGICGRYGLAVLSVSVALAGALLLGIFHFRDVELPLFLFAVAVTAWYGGAGAAVLALLLSGLIFDYFFIEPLYTLRMQLAPDLPSLMGDRVQLQQVIVNLILNGIEAMSTVRERERSLVISTAGGEGDDEVLVAVQDSGIGLDPKDLERIFDAFHTTKPGGLGMGLSISRSIVERHGGRLWAEANVGPAVTFRFSLQG